MAYDLPGNVEGNDAQLRLQWNAAIQRTFDSMADLHSRFFTLDHARLASPMAAPLSWFGDPAEPAFCLGAAVAQQLSDWGVRGRHGTHNEYCEYVVIYRPDSTGKTRPKGVHDFSGMMAGVGSGSMMGCRTCRAVRSGWR